MYGVVTNDEVFRFGEYLDSKPVSSARRAYLVDYNGRSYVIMTDQENPRWLENPFARATPCADLPS